MIVVSWNERSGLERGGRQLGSDCCLLDGQFQHLVAILESHNLARIPLAGLLKPVVEFGLRDLLDPWRGLDHDADLTD
jgi:hypothetical protein